MTLRQLEYFVTLAETLNFTRAARKCSISQTAMTQQIHALEESVGAQLLVRTKHKVALTPAGQILCTEAKALLARTDNAARLARTAARGTGGAITVGYICGLEQLGMGTLLHDFSAAYPDISLRLIRENASRLYQALDDGDCDVIISLAPAVARPMPGIEHRHIRDCNLFAVVNSENPLAQYDRLPYSSLKAQDFVITQPRGSITEQTEEVLQCRERGNFTPNIVQCEPDLENVLLLVAGGAGVSIMADYAINTVPHNGLIRAIPLVRGDGIPEIMGLEMARRGDSANHAANVFWAWAEGHVDVL